MVIFDYSSWVTRYPEFVASVSPQLAGMYFIEAELYCNNSIGSLIQDESRRSLLLNMLVSHIAFLNQPGSSPLVGRLTSASEGGVSASMDNQYPPGSAQWFQQTKYGAAYWAATACYRTAKYVPGYPRNTDPFRPW